MRSSRPVFLLAFGFFISTAVHAQQLPQRDPQALAVLAQMAAATGWSPVALPADAVGSGSVTVQGPSGPDTYNITVKARPGHQLRTEFPTRGTTLVVNGEQGKHITPERTEQLQPYATFSMNASVFPFFGVLGDYASPDVSVSYLGTETVHGETAQRIEVKRQSNRGDSLDRVRERASRLVVCVSSTSYLPLKVEFERISTNNETAARRVVYYLSDYRRVGPLLVPFRVEELAPGGQPRITLQLQSVQFNSGLADAEFSVE